MKARLASSKKWTAFPDEYQQKIQEVFTEAFAEALTNEHFVIDGRFYKKELFLSVTLNSEGRLAQANFAVSQDFNSSKENAIEKIYGAIDCLASFIDQYFSANRDTQDLPRVWDRIDFEGKEFYIQFSPENSELEQAANRLLGIDKNSDDLLMGEDDEEELEILKQTIGIDDDDKH
ncbi:MAG: hypothetical protein KDD61_10355 [Bdellovibrionales bacterium]|nr:hypothetical protein [Bdellovibrionales bacterium]